MNAGPTSYVREIQQHRGRLLVLASQGEFLETVSEIFYGVTFDQIVVRISEAAMKHDLRCLD